MATKKYKKDSQEMAGEIVKTLVGVIAVIRDFSAAVGESFFYFMARYSGLEASPIRIEEERIISKACGRANWEERS